MNLLISLQPSSALLKLLKLLWAMVLLAFLVVSWHFRLLVNSPWWFVAMLVLLLVLAGWQLRMVTTNASSIRQIQFIDGAWYLLCAQAEKEPQRVAIRLAADSVVWPYWILLRYTPEGEAERLVRKRQLLIWRDSVSDTEFRHLSRVLRYYRSPSA